MAAGQTGTGTETVARVTEITARSSQSFEDAIRVGIERATKTLRHVQGAWIKEQRVEIEEGQIIGYQVNMLITFVLEDTA
jgi:flavin-binding protein dodecin